MEAELGTTWTRAVLVMVSSVAMLMGIIAYVRIVGLRSFSKMSTFDFVVTVAIGSMLGSVSLSSSSLSDGLIAVGVLLGTQAGIAWLRLRGLGSAFDNEPVVLMIGSRMLDENMRRARVTADDIRSKLRAANVGTIDDSVVVILETTGDVSVLHGHEQIDPSVLEGVRDAGAAK